MVLRGVLEASFGNILCLRGFAKLGELADISTADESYQREVDAGHRNDITSFYESGRYLFFPELILGASFPAIGLGEAKFAELYEAVKVGHAVNFPNRKGITIKMFVKRYKDNYFQNFVTASFYGLEWLNETKPIRRIDGNHRLEAVEDNANEKLWNVRNYQVPFCLVLFANEDECQRGGRAFFNLINFRAKPISEEKNLELILEQDVFDDETLLKPPFGAEYWLTRWFFLVRWLANGFKPNKPAVLEPVSRTALLHFFAYLFETKRYDRNDFGALQRNIDVALSRVQELISSNDEWKVVAKDENALMVMIYYVLDSRVDLCQAFVAWFSKNRVAAQDDSDSIGFQKLIEMFERGRKTGAHTIFVSMQFGSCGTERNFEVIKQVVNELNREYTFDPPLRVVRVDQICTGETFEINEQVIKEVSSCGYLIADLTYCNSNVYHEVGLLMGRTLALTGKHEYGMTLILDENVSQECKIVKFNISSLQQLRFKKESELHDGIIERLKLHYGV